MHPTSSTILPPFSAKGAKRSESADHFGRTPRLGRVAMVNLGRSNPAGWGLARGLLYLFDRRNKGRTRAWGRSVSTGFDRVQQDYCSRKGYFSPTRPCRFTDTSPTVRPVPWAIKPTSCPARSVWEPSYHIDCHFHGRHLCRQVAPDYPLYWVPRSRQGPPYCECVRGNKQVHGAASHVLQTPPRIAHSIPPARVLWPNPIVDPSRSTGLDHSLEIFPKVDHVLGTPFQTINEVNKPRTMHLRRCRSQTISRPARFWSSSRQNTTKTLITCSPKTIPLSPQPSTPVHASSAICLWSSCNTSRSLRAGVCATPQYDQPWSSARGCFTGSPSTS